MTRRALAVQYVCMRVNIAICAAQAAAAWADGNTHAQGGWLFATFLTIVLYGIEKGWAEPLWRKEIKEQL
jgi:hypothetical protein